MIRASKYNRYWDRQAILFDKKQKGSEEKIYKVCYDYIKQYIRKDSNIADLGCGTGNIAFEVAEHVKSIIAIDSSEAMISLANAKKRKPQHNHIQFIREDIEYTGLEKHSMDACLMCNLIQFLEHPELVISEAKRIVKPNGIIICTTHCLISSFCLRNVFQIIKFALMRFFNKIPCIHFYTYKSLRKLLESKGLIIIAEKRIKSRGKNGLFTVLKT
jgi:ubiquinone/menaquinone biosynthesis C-methylase UbiE